MTTAAISCGWRARAARAAQIAQNPEKASLPGGKLDAGAHSGSDGGALVLTASSGSGSDEPGCEAATAAFHLRLLPVSTPHLAAVASQATI
jgi:hypothetical protein